MTTNTTPDAGTFVQIDPAYLFPGDETVVIVMAAGDGEAEVAFRDGQHLFYPLSALTITTRPANW